MRLLSHDHVHFAPHFESVLASFRDGVPEDIVLISDFDQTLTQFIGNDGRAGLQCHDIMLEFMNPDAKPGLREKLEPLIEWVHMSEPERMKLCDGDAGRRKEKAKWWFDTFCQLGAEYNFSEQVSESVSKSNTVPRESLAETVQMVTEFNVPFIVVSAGISQVILAILARANIRLPLGEQGRLIANDISSPVARITSRNKSTALQFVEDFATLTVGRKRAIVLGDKAADCDVTKMLPEDWKVLKVGFMRDDVPVGSSSAALKEQLDHFDAVVTGDASMGFVNDLLRESVVPKAFL
eukprot:TRINITY_DN51998_c0_g1_i1.p1 TRINITY_DN51998_c0_g1~~TRINITY_DN51998_c0_g1_i1.p1  ORF type:complete len:295 (+),score=43.24 TRINITY_DN51998_c0_g1_i1:44-928(+)